MELKNESGKPSPSVNFIAGSWVGSTAQSIIYPLEVMKTCACLRKTVQFSSVLDCALAVYRETAFWHFIAATFSNG